MTKPADKRGRIGRRVDKLLYGWSGSAWTPVSTSGETRFIYDGWNMVSDYDATGGTFGVRLHSYVWGLDLSWTLQGGGGVGGLLATISASGVINLVAYDGNGNVMGLTDHSSGAVNAAYEYSPFGETLRATGLYAQQNPFQYSTKYTDIETGCICYGRRYYDPKTGRWLSRDPMEEIGGLNLYAFVRNNPINQWDYLGNDTGPYTFGADGDDSVLYDGSGNAISAPAGQVWEDVNGLPVLFDGAPVTMNDYSSYGGAGGSGDGDGDDATDGVGSFTDLSQMSDEVEAQEEAQEAADDAQQQQDAAAISAADSSFAASLAAANDTTAYSENNTSLDTTGDGLSADMPGIDDSGASTVEDVTDSTIAAAVVTQDATSSNAGGDTGGSDAVATAAASGNSTDSSVQTVADPNSAPVSYGGTGMQTGGVSVLPAVTVNGNDPDNVENESGALSSAEQAASAVLASTETNIYQINNPAPFAAIVAGFENLSGALSTGATIVNDGAKVVTVGFGVAAAGALGVVVVENVAISEATKILLLRTGMVVADWQGAVTEGVVLPDYSVMEAPAVEPSMTQTLDLPPPAAAGPTP